MQEWLWWVWTVFQFSNYVKLPSWPFATQLLHYNSTIPQPTWTWSLRGGGRDNTNQSKDWGRQPLVPMLILKGIYFNIFHSLFCTPFLPQASHTHLQSSSNTESPAVDTQKFLVLWFCKAGLNNSNQHAGSWQCISPWTQNRKMQLKHWVKTF